MTHKLGPLELQALAYGQTRGKQTLESGAFVQAFGWSVEQERKVLSRLAGKGFIVRVRPGLYLVPRFLPVGGHWSPGEYLALNTLMQDRDGRYQISGPNAFYRYGWTDQVPNRLYAYNNRISGERKIGPIVLSLVKIADDRLGGTELMKLSDGVEVVYANKARALLDAVYDYERFDTLPRAFEWIRREVARSEGFASNLVQTSLAFGNQATLRRIGEALERCEAPAKLLERIERALNTSTARIPWIPDRPKRGSNNPRWGIVRNDE